MANIVNPGIDEEELRRQAEDAQRLAEEKAAEAQANAQAEAQKAEENARAANEAAQQAAARTEEAAKKAQEQGFNRTVQEKIHGVEVELLEAGDIQSPVLSSELEEELNKKNRRGELGYGTSWGATNEVAPDYSTIRDNEQAVFLGTLVDPTDRMEYFKQYAKQSGQNLEDVLAYADERLGTRIFATPQSNAGKRNTMLDALDGLDLFDIAGEDIDVYSADFDVLVQSLNNIADEETRKDGAEYLESLTKIPGSPFYGRMFDKGDIEYRNSADLPESVYKEEIKALGGTFKVGQGFEDVNKEAYLAKFQEFHSLYGDNPYAFRQMESALRAAYEKQTGYVAPKASDVIAVLEEKATQAAQNPPAEEDKGWFDRFFDLFTGNKKEKPTIESEEPKKPVEGKDYSFREAYIASAGPMPSMPPVSSAAPAGLLAENSAIGSTVETAKQNAGERWIENLPAEEKEAETVPQRKMEGRWIDERVSSHEAKKAQPRMTETEALKWCKAGRASELSEENYALVKDVWENDTFRSLALYGIRPTDQQLYDQDQLNGYPLTEEERLERAFETTSAYQLLGSTLGGVADTLNSGAMPEDIALEGQLLMGDIINLVDRRVRGGRVHIPQGANKYDYVISQFDDLQKKADQLTGLQSRVNAIQANRAIEAAHDYDRAVESAEQAFISGRPLTQEQVMLLADQAKEASPEAFRNDKARRDLRYMLDPNAFVSYYKDDGAFWTGNSAAAQEGQRLRETHSDGNYDLYKFELREAAYEVIDDLTNTAYGRGMTLEQMMDRMGIGINQVMDMAYNRIRSEGAQILKDPELMQTADALASGQTKSIGYGGALAAGWNYAAADNKYHFMNAPYQIIDLATYETRRQDIYADFNKKWGKYAAGMYRKALIDYANSGEMPSEQAQALIEDVSNTPNPFDIAFEIDPGWLASSYREAMWEYKKDAEALASTAATLPEYEQDLFEASANVRGNIGPMVASAALTVGTGALGAPMWAARALGSVPHASIIFSQTLEDNKRAGLTDTTAAWMAFGEAAAMSAIESFGAEKTVAGSLLGSSLARDGLETALRRTGTGGLNVLKAMARTSALDYGLGEAGEEVAQTLVGKGVDAFLPAIKGVEEGVITTPAQFTGAVFNEFKQTDHVALLKEAKDNGTMGFVWGTLLSLPIVGSKTYRAVKNVNIQTQYPSIDIASKIVHGELPADDKTIGTFIDLVRQDSKDPKYQTALNKTADAAMQAEYVTVSAMSGAGHDFRVSAVAESEKANDYETKAQAAKKAVETNKSQFIRAQQLAMQGNKGAAHTMEGFRTAWAKAQTTETENRQAAKKSREKAAEYTSKWLQECRKMASVLMRFDKQSAVKQISSMFRSMEADEMEAATAEAEANVTAMGAEEFIENRYPNASDAEKDHIREIYGVPVGAKAPASDVQTEAVSETVTPAVTDASSADAQPAVASVQPAAASVNVQNAQTEAQAAQTVAPVQTASQPPVTHAAPMPMQNTEQRVDDNRKRQVKAAVDFGGQVKRRYGVNVEVVPLGHQKLALRDGKTAPASYDRETDTIYVSENATQGDIIRAKVVHELTHRTEGTDAYKEFSEAIQAAYFKGNEQNKNSFKKKIRDTYAANGVNLSAEGLEHEVVARITEDLLGGNQELVDRLVADSPSVARRIMDAIKTVLDKLRGVKGADVDQLRAVEKMFQKALDEAATQKRSFSSDNIQYSLREKEPPKNVVYAYKAFYARDGKLYPPMVANITDEADKQKVKGATSGTMKSLPTPVGVWLDADIGGIMTDESGTPVRSKDTKRLRVKNDKSGGGATLAFRPGWHLGEWPDAKQFNKADPETGERGKRMPDDLVFAKCEVSADVDYQLDALSYGLNNKGGFSRSQAGLPYVPDDGYYKYRTNVDPTTAPWLIAGSIKVVEILDDADCARICAEFGVTPDQRYSGKPIDLSEYGLKRGPVEATTEGMEQFKENDANRANKKLLENALNDPEFADAYVQREIDFDNPKQYEQLQKEFAMNGQDIEAYRKKYETEGFASKHKDNIQFSINDDEYMQALKSGDEDAAWERLEEEMALNSISWPYTAYRSAPDSLMGFGRNQKGYDEQRYPKTVMVRVRFGDDVFEDEIKGMNKAHAMERARRNWEDADEISFVSMEDVRYSIDEPLALPDDDFLRAEIDAWRSNPNYSVDENTGKRQFANQTVQNNPHIPDYIKQAFLNDPAKSDYSRESNMRQLNEAWNRVQNEGLNDVKDRLLAQDTTFTTEDNADALVLMSQSLHDDDLDTFMSIASKYNVEGTDQAKALQIRSLMKTMTPTGFAQKVIKDASRKMDEHLKNHNRQSKKISRKVKDIDDKLGLRNLDGRSGIQKLVEAGESIKIDNKYGVPLNDRKRVLIKEFGLEKVRHPGMFYNWASTKQRMLMDILTTDDVYAEDYNGFNLVERLIRMEAGQPVVTKADIAYITENMNLFNSYADRNSRDANIALSRAYEAYGNINPATGKMKRRTWRYTSMLLSVPSAIRNVIGNAAQSVPNAIADGVAVELDRLFSAITGADRTRAHINISDRIDGWEAFRDETFNTFRDYFIDKTVTQYGEGRYNESQRGRVFENQFGETLRRMEGLLMSVGDRSFWKKKFFNSLAEQQHLAEINGTEFNLEQAMETAEAEANYATFNEDNAVRSLFTKMKDIPAIGTVLDHIMPFTGVPTNIIKRQIEFSPIGIAATAWKHGLNAIKGGDFDQRAFVDGMARGLTGSAMMGIGAILLKEGILKMGTKEEDDDKSYGVRTAQGDQYGVYFTIGDKNYSISTFSPAASALVAGAFVADALKNNEAWYQAIVNGTLKNVNEIFDASYMSSLADLLNTSNGGNIVDNAAPTVLNSMLTQNIPAPITHLASAMDPYVRDTKDKDAIMEVVKTTMSKIPGARELLPEKVDVAGRAVENTKYGAAAFIDPFSTSYVVDDPALNEMIRLRDVLTEKGASEPRAHMASDALSGRRNTLTQNKVTYTVTPEEKETFRKRYGELWREGGITYDKKGRKVAVQGVEELIASRYYQLMDEEEQAEAIKEIVQMAKAGATYEIMNHK